MRHHDMKQSTPVRTDLVLVGSGHAHVQVLKSFGMRPEPGVRITLITKDLAAPYSGMLPGYVAGHYTHDEIHIDAMKLARFCDARFIHAEALGVDRHARRVLLRDRPPLAYDLLSIDIGIVPDVSDIAGADAHAIPVKPIAAFSQQWEEVERRALSAHGPRRLTVIGGGAAGFELVLAMAHRLRTRAAAAGIDPLTFTFQLVCAPRLLPSHSTLARSLGAAALRERAIAILEGQRVVEIGAGFLRLADGTRLASDATLVTTKAAPARWFAQTGLATTADGFLALRPTLQLRDDDDVFAAGDCATVEDHPRPKAGVFAVRQGPPLTDNLRRRVHGEPAVPFRPQASFLSILALGDQQAIAARGPLATRGRWVWHWKDRIDRAFMERFQDLPAMHTTGGVSGEPERCGGCAAKVGPEPLAGALSRLGPNIANAQIDMTHADDAAILDTGGDTVRVESVDYFRAFWGDPFVFGAVAANHAMNDVFAMGGVPDHALAICTLPHGRGRTVSEDLFQLMAGARSRFDAEGVTLAGGHSSEGPEMAAGFFVSGEVARGRILRKGGLRPGDRLIVTRPLGTGILFAAEMRGAARGSDVAAALAVMMGSNAAVARTLVAHGAVAMTDVTGFGFAGHLLEMLDASGVAASVQAAVLPVYSGARELAENGVVSTLLTENVVGARRLDWPAGPDTALTAILFDPQTSGGLLAGLPEAAAEACLAVLRAGPAPHAQIVGTIAAGSPRIVIM